MGLFRRSGNGDGDTSAGEANAGVSRFHETDDSLVDGDGMGPLRPRDRGLGEQERARIAAGLAALGSAGVDIADLDAMGAAYDATYAAWRDTAKRKRENHDALVEQFAIGLGEHLTRHTDLRWRIVTDVFGTDLAIADQREGDFVVVPGNLVASRWMRGETGWLPGVARHLIRVRGESTAS
ncbi:MAG TPA: DUF3806 domain-containing protein [Tetrasphaera sp.]|uniref:DUF3806 domain-containing protein n=1 Tax=Nostocoides sp. TaxID=1917966 RepID=UPI002CDE79F8|nr:DUF3806 domain-containing protein [Tetrasphaera sp.]HNQ06825.1 DUF3806 domain-containing protein [Tetrasphaera sp.]